MTKDYFPEILEIDKANFPTSLDLERILGKLQGERVLIPHDCTDGFVCAYWSRLSGRNNMEIYLN